VIQTIFLLQKIRVTLKLKKLFRGKFKTYEIHFEDEDINLTADITDYWKLETKNRTLYLVQRKIRNLIVASTSGKVNVSYNHDNNEINTSGSGYHDHNWGNNSIMEYSTIGIGQELKLDPIM
jgi:hypothetical protein